MQVDRNQKPGKMRANFKNPDETRSRIDTKKQAKNLATWHGH